MDFLPLVRCGGQYWSLRRPMRNLTRVLLVALFMLASCIFGVYGSAIAQPALYLKGQL